MLSVAVCLLVFCYVVEFRLLGLEVCAVGLGYVVLAGLG